MTRARRVLLPAMAVVWMIATSPVAAHPVPFTYLDLHVSPTAIEGALVLHNYDLGHDLKIEPPERLLDQAFASSQLAAIADMVSRRLTISADGRALSAPWTDAEVLTDRSSIRIHWRHALDGPAGRISVEGLLFPYDDLHQTFVNLYDASALTQAIIDKNHPLFEYFAGTRQGTFAVVKKFIPAGVHHILIGPDHILFLVGLMLLGGSFRRLALIVTGFTLAHSITLSLAALKIFTPPAWVIEPAIALSIVYVGVDNLVVKQGRDFRAWIAFGFGFIHGFGFANVLREMNLPSRALGWTLFSFNAGVEVGQLMIVAVAASVLALVRSRSEAWGRRVAFVGSIGVIAVGLFWFIERIAFPGGE